MIEPIRPEDIPQVKAQTFPSAVIESFNELITQNFTLGCATVKQEDVIQLMVRKGLSQRDIFDKGWLNVEDVYRASGWRVEYDKPGYNESYPAVFIFKKKSKR